MVGGKDVTTYIIKLASNANGSRELRELLRFV